MVPIELEAPSSSDDLYLARGEDVQVVGARPLFTGDVLELNDGTMVILLQHPCSMRNGLTLVPQLIVSNVVPWDQRVPSDWTKYPKKMFLLEFRPNQTYAVDFVQVRTIAAEQAEQATRLAVLSQRGVNLLLQRWANHLTRVVVPTTTLHESIAAEHEEADLIGDQVGDLIDRGLGPDSAAKLVDDWLNVQVSGNRRRKLLRDPQARSGLRKQLRADARAWNADSSGA